MSPTRVIHRYIQTIVFLALIGVVLLVLLPQTAAALTISPPRIEVQVDPGGVYSGVYRLTNDSSSSRTFASSFENFEAQGESGNPKFVENGDGLAGWLSGPEVITLDGGETREIPFSITVPATADPGGYFSAIFWSLAPADTADGQIVRLSAKIGTLILLRVNGDINEEGGVLEFDTVDAGRFYTELPIEFYYRFQNGGTDRILPRGTLSAKNFFGGVRYYNANKTEGNVLPGTVRRFSALWGQPREGEVIEGGFFPAVKRQWQQFAFGPYRVDLDLTYGSLSQSVHERIKIFVLPWQLLVTVLVSLGTAIFVLFWVLRRYNRWVIRRAQRQFAHMQTINPAEKNLAPAKKRRATKKSKEKN